MPPPPVVEDLEVIEQLAARRRPRGPRRVVDELDLQRREETLGHGVVPAIAPAAHAAHDPVLGQGALVVAAGVLTGEALLAPPRKRRSQVHPITRDGKWVDGERVTEGSAVVKKRGNARGAKGDRKSTRLNSSHRCISYAVFCLKKKKKKKEKVKKRRNTN